MKYIYISIIILFIIIIILEPKVNFYSFNNGHKINHFFLPDIIHNNFPPVSPALSDNFNSCIIISFFIIAIYYRKFNYLIIALILFFIIRLFNFVYFISTTLPDSSKKCVYSKNLWENTLNLGSCNNLNISGHLSNSIILLFLIYCIIGRKYGPLFILIYATAFLLIVVSRNHYTVDCLTSTLLGLLIITQFSNIVKVLNYLCGRKYFEGC